MVFLCRLALDITTEKVILFPVVGVDLTREFGLMKRASAAALVGMQPVRHWVVDQRLRGHACVLSVLRQIDVNGNELHKGPDIDRRKCRSCCPWIVV